MARRPNPEIQAGITPSRKKKPHPASKVPISRAEMAHIKAITSGVGRDIAGAAIARGESVTSRALARVAAAPTHRPSFLHQALAPLAHDVARTADLGSGLLDVAKKAPDATQRLADYFNRPSPKGTETGSDALLGKSATNLVFHGDTSHLGASGLEIASMLPIVRGGRILGRATLEGASALGRTAPEAKAALGVADVLPAAKKVRKAQEAGYSVERGKRFGNARKAFGQAGGGEAGLNAMLGEHKGALPKIDFNLLREGDYSQAQLDREINAIMEHPALKEGQAMSAAQGLRNMAKQGVVPQGKQLEHLATVFGPDETAKLVAQTLGGRVQDTLGLMRSLQTTLDLSLNMRQALPLLFRSPNIWRKSAAPQIKALLKEKNFKEADNLLRSDPDFQLAARVQPRLFTSIEGRAGVDRSEYFPSTLAEKIPLVKHPVRASGRAFEIGQNMGILNSFKSMMARAEKWGVNINPDTADGLRELKGMLDVAGAQVGRGIFKTKTFKGAQPLLSQGLYAPSFYKSRLTWFSPRWYIKLPKVARYEAIRTMGQFLGGTSAILYGAHAAGAGVAVDPRSSDFGKIRLGDTRLDAMGGFQQWARMAAQLMPEKLYGGDTWAGKYVDTNTGQVKNFQSGIGNRTRWDALLAFATGKASPPASLIIDAFKGTDYQYRPFEWKRAVYSRMLPLVAQDVLDVYKQTGSVPAAVAAYGAAATGVGVQTYIDQTPKKQAEKFKAWKGQAEKDWQAIHPGLPLPMNVVRAKRDSDAIAAAAAQFPNASVPENKRTPAQAQEHDHAQLTFLVDYLLKTHPDLEQYRSSYDALLSSSPLAIHAAIPKIHHGIMGGAWDNYLAQVNAYHKRKTYGNG